jgi:TDG/mug DNA glycosylase family protein
MFCGINPALSAARAGHHFSNPSNRFWRVIHLAGFTPFLILPENDRTILEYGCGLTAAVERPTARAATLRAVNSTKPRGNSNESFVVIALDMWRF